MRQINGENLYTLKEASEKYEIPVSWIRRQIGKPLPNGKFMRTVKFPSDRNHYVFELELEEMVKPRVFNPEYIKQSQKDYEENPDIQEKWDE